MTNLKEGDVVVTRVGRWWNKYDLDLVVEMSPYSKELWLKDGELWHCPLKDFPSKSIKEVRYA